MPNVTIYTRRGCCLCEEARRVLDCARLKTEFHLQEVDIDSEPDLRELYKEEVPVIAINGRKVFQYQVDLDALLIRLSAEP
jgi:glutaredoxin